MAITVTTIATEAMSIYDDDDGKDSDAEFPPKTSYARRTTSCRYLSSADG